MKALLPVPMILAPLFGAGAGHANLRIDRIVFAFDRATGKENLNWRESRLCLLKKD